MALPRRFTPTRIVLCLLLASGVISCLAQVGADETSKNEEKRARMLKQMTDLAAEAKLILKNARREPKLVPQPVFRYDDQPRRFIDATMWVWTDGGRPVAFEKVEAMIHRDTGEAQWGYCFTSVSEDQVAIHWNETRDYHTTQAGTEFKPLEGAPEVFAKESQRKRQARDLAKGFAARVVIDPKNNTTQEMRLLTTPIYEYTDEKTKEYSGSVFALSTNGTNPDLLVLLEPREGGGKLQWQIAPARMTSGGVTLNYRDKKVWDCPFVSPREAPFATWTFFQVPRKALSEE
jgi:hypothetical protein